MKTRKPKYFKYGFLSSLTGKFGESLSISINTLLVALGATAFQIGFISALNTLGKTFSQFLGLWYLNLFSSRKKSEIVAMIIIGLPTIILIFISFTQAKYWFTIIAIIMFLEGLAGQASYLCWYSWMSSIVPIKFRNYFFATRSLFGEMGRITGFIIAFFVLNLEYPILILLGFLYMGRYVFSSIGETSMYFFHPDAKRKVLVKNHILQRMKKTLHDKKFTNFMYWFTLLNSVLILNILYLEYFMINELKLSYLWIPISFLILSLSSAASFYSLRNYFENISYRNKRLVINILILFSCLIWLFIGSTTSLILALSVAGFSIGALTLSEKVDLISLSKKQDKEAHYAVFKFVSSLLITILTLALSLLQLSAFNFSLVFYFTITLTLIGFMFLKNPRY